MFARRIRKLRSAPMLLLGLLLLLPTTPTHAQSVRPSHDSFFIDLGPAPQGTLLTLPSIQQPFPPLPPSDLQAWPAAGNGVAGAAYWLGWIAYDAQNTGFSIYRRAAGEAFPP